MAVVFKKDIRELFRGILVAAWGACDVRLHWRKVT